MRAFLNIYISANTQTTQGEKKGKIPDGAIEDLKLFKGVHICIIHEACLVP
jgi:hypothetical protein